jgi:hypothetical protein
MRQSGLPMIAAAGSAPTSTNIRADRGASIFYLGSVLKLEGSNPGAVLNHGIEANHSELPDQMREKEERQCEP